MTQRYMHLSPAALDAAIRLLDAQSAPSFGDSPVTVPNSMLPGEGIASREEGCRRVAWFLFQTAFPFGSPAYSAIIGRRQGFIRAAVRGEG
jgi:hypothetical protein